MDTIHGRLRVDPLHKGGTALNRNGCWRAFWKLDLKQKSTSFYINPQGETVAFGKGDDGQRKAKAYAQMMDKSCGTATAARKKKTKAIEKRNKSTQRKKRVKTGETKLGAEKVVMALLQSFGMWVVKVSNEQSGTIHYNHSVL
jgi:hypothetical protein